MREPPDTVDLGELAAALRRGWRRIAAGALVGLLAAVAVYAFAPRRYEGTATILLKGAQEGTGSLSARMGLPADLLNSPLAASLRSDLETEMTVLGSRAVIGSVVDSLGLQARVASPSGTPSDAIVDPAVYAGSFARRTYRFRREGSTGPYAVSGGGTSASAEPGKAVRLPIGDVTLRAESLPPAFAVAFSDREDAITWAAKHLTVEKAGGEVARVTFRAGDSLTAARVPNALVAVYLERRKTTDRGTNQRRLEFLLALTDTVAQRLAQGEDRLRRFQESSGVVDPALTGRSELERATVLRQQLEQIEVESAALNQMLAQTAAGALTARQLAAYPTFLRSQAINDLLAQAATLETERLRLLERRTERDPEVQALSRSIQNLDAQLTPLATAYADALGRQRRAVATQLDTVRGALAALPGQTETSLQLQRDVQRLSQTEIALQAQVVEAKLAAISEGGDVRQIDVAQPPKKPVFPRPLGVLLAGLAAGLLAGLLAALQATFLGRWVRRTGDVERAVGLPAARLGADALLLLGTPSAPRTVLVVPVGTDAPTDEVVRQLAASAAERAVSVGVVDVERAATGPAGSVLRAVREAEAAYGAVVAALPALDRPAAAALLDPARAVLFVGRAGRLGRAELVEAAETVRRLGVPCSGVVLAAPESGWRS